MISSSETLAGQDLSTAMKRDLNMAHSVWCQPSSYHHFTPYFYLGTWVLLYRDKQPTRGVSHPTQAKAESPTP